MKRVNNIYNRICDIDAIIDIYNKNIRLNTKNKRKIEEFENNYSANIKYIKEMLVSKTYVPGKYNIFLISEPKMRIIMSQEIIDKIINHLVAKYFLIEVFDKSLSDRNCATRINKGTHYAARLFERDYNYLSNRYEVFYILKMDISKYFYNLDHEIIMDIVKSKIKDQDAIDLINAIINTTNEEYINKTIYRLKNNYIRKINNSNYSNKSKRIKEIEALPYYEYGKGACIGNMVSQIIATVYLDKLDKYIIDELGFKHYARYMDDFYIMCEDKDRLKRSLIIIDDMLRTNFKLKLNNKTKIYKSTDSVEFLGFRYTYNNGINKRLTNKAKIKFKNKMKIVNYGFSNGIIDYSSYRAVRDSYKGWLDYGNCYFLYNKYVQYK